MTDINTGLELVYKVIAESIEAETVEDGLLNDVNTVVNSFRNDNRIDEPIIWITQHPTYNSQTHSLSRAIELTVPFELDAGVYDRDPDTGFLKSQNLANRVIISVLKNWRHMQHKYLPDSRVIKSISLETYSPVGYVDIKGLSSRLSVTGVVLGVNCIVDWNKCIIPDKSKFNKFNKIVNDGATKNE